MTNTNTTPPTDTNPVQAEIALDEILEVTPEEHAAAPAADAPDDEVPETVGETIHFYEVPATADDGDSAGQTLIDLLDEAQAAVCEAEGVLAGLRGDLLRLQTRYDVVYAQRYMERLGEKLTEEARKQDCVLHAATEAADIVEGKQAVLQAEAEFNAARRARDVAKLAWCEIYGVTPIVERMS